MGFYNDKILPRLIMKAMDLKELAPLRRKVVANVHGIVVELGIGSGSNIPFYPPTLDLLIGIDNHPEIVRYINVESSMQSKVEIKVADAASIPVGDETADFVVSTFTLCSVTEPEVVLKEVRRVLKPDGRFVFLEHGLSDSASVQRWQNILTPLNRKIAGGCCLNRDFASLLPTTGFKVEMLENFYLPKAPKTHGYLYQGAASKGEW